MQTLAAMYVQTPGLYQASTNVALNAHLECSASEATLHHQTSPAHFGHFFHPRPCPSYKPRQQSIIPNPTPAPRTKQKSFITHTCFHVRINSGISRIACLRLSSLAFCVRSVQWPRTRWPTPVPLTRRPRSRRRSSAASLPLRDRGSSPSTPCRRASFTSSACRRSENAGASHLPVCGLR